MGFFEEQLTKPNIVAAIQRDAAIATILPEDMPRPETIVPQAYATLLKHPSLFEQMDKLAIDRWKIKPHLLSYLISGEEALVYSVYGVPFILKATTSPDSDIIHGSQFVAKPSARRSVMLKDSTLWEQGERPQVELILERWLYKYNALRDSHAKTPQDPNWVFLEREDKKILENCLLYEGLQFKDQKISNARYYGINTRGQIEEKPSGMSFSSYPVVTDVGSLERVVPQKNRLSSDTNEASFLYNQYRKIYLDLHSDMCPIRGLEAALSIAKMSELRWQQDTQLYQKLKKDGLSDDNILERNENLTLAGIRNQALLYDAKLFLERR